MTSGFRYTFAHKALFAMILFHTWLNMSFGINSVIRQPYILGFSTEEQFGLVTSLFGIGMALGSVFLSLVKVDMRLMTIIFVSNVGMGLAVMLTGVTQQIFFIGFLWVIMGFLLPVGNTLSITLIQRNTDQAIWEEYSRFHECCLGLRCCGLFSRRNTCGCDDFSRNVCRSFWRR